MNEKIVRPPYASYRSFESLLSELKDHEVMPAVIDRSTLQKRSGSEQSALLATFKWFDLIDEKHVPTALLDSYIAADQEQAKSLLKEMIESSYTFVSDGTFNLRNATSNQMADKFRQYDISGSTLTKSVAFFLAAAKSAGIFVSPHVKAPSAPGGNTKKKSPKSMPSPVEQPLVHGTQQQSSAPHANSKMIRIPIPIMGMDDGSINLPDNMDARQWASVIKMTEFILQNYRDTMAATPPAKAEDDLI
ncbi:hypothetical protein PSCICO_44200 [Pseudomonas cichorii]|uniref:DUF5343 domain-containing protein n=1 Tax=Pseudomonas cichorii TaxID=36746 RepID=UPI001910530A|nr:DUF5343 domain-containing protein [Pseudomonas cichorii]GFM89021.1 hypothetical protein PSCICO_44200 [Pseudomonas cichorii]